MFDLGISELFGRFQTLLSIQIQLRKRNLPIIIAGKSLCPIHVRAIVARKLILYMYLILLLRPWFIALVNMNQHHVKTSL